MISFILRKKIAEILGVCLIGLSTNAALAQELLVDTDFNDSTDIADLRANSAGQDWYESRNDTPTLLTLETGDVSGNSSKKAALKNYGGSGIAYLTQEFSTSQSDDFTVTFDIYIDRIQNVSSYDRSGLIYIGNDSIGSNAPTGTSNERFVLMAFYDSSPGDTGNDLQIKARTSSSQSWSSTSTWTSLANGLSYDTWYRLRIDINPAGSYDLYIDDVLQASGIPKYSGYSASSVDLVTFAVDENARGDFYVDNVSTQDIPPNPGDIILDANFDSGSIQSYGVNGNTINMTLRTENLVNSGSSYTYWANFKLSNVLNEAVTLNFTGIDSVTFLSHQGPEENQMVYSCDGENWDRLTQYFYSSSNGGTYTVDQTFPCEEVQIATFFPFSYQKMQGLVDNAATSQSSTLEWLGTSPQGRDIDLLTITNPSVPSAEKAHVYIIGRQHAAETSSSHMLEGLIEFLLSSDPYAQSMRDNIVWYFVPMVNPDGVFEGNSRATADLRDPNRDWGNNLSSVVTIVRDHLDLINNIHGVDMFLDWHSQMNDDSWYNFIYSPPGNDFFPILSLWTDFDDQQAVGTSCSSSSCSSRGYTTSQGIFNFVLEPTPHLVTWTHQSLMTEGINTGSAIAEYFGAIVVDDVPPFPDPATFAQHPNAVDSSSITMTATTGEDDSGPVEYFFAETTGKPGGSDSGWQTGSTYLDTGLNPDTTYAYTVKMRDVLGNEGTASAPESATTQSIPNQPPTAVVSANLTSGVVPLLVSFDASGTNDSDGTIVSYAWDFGDGINGTGATPSHTYTAAGSYTAEVTVTDDDGATDTASVLITVDPAIDGQDILRNGIVFGVTNTGWMTVTLDKSFTSMVVVATVQYDNTMPPMVSRIQNAAGNSFDVRVDRADGSSSAVSGVTVNYLVVEEGVYTQANDGITMEAVKFSSTATDRRGSWVGQSRTYANSYTSPVVVGQVMTYNDADHSVFWARGSSRNSPPSASQLSVGKHVSEDSDTTRADETVGYVVVEAGSGSFDGIAYAAGVGGDSVRGVDNTPPYSYSFSLPGSAETAVLSSSAMDGNDGAWPFLYGTIPLGGSTVSLAVDEDQFRDSERRHTTEQVAYLVLGSAP